MIVPERPTLDAAVTDTLKVAYFMVAINLQGDETGFSIDDVETVNCTISEIGALVCKVTPLQLGEVTLKIKANAVTAGNFASEVLMVYYKPSQTGLDAMEISGNLLIYPSPVKDYLEISLQQEQDLPVKIVLLDLYGRMISSHELQSGSVSINCSGLPAGVYLVKFIMQGQEVMTQKIIKE